MGQTTKMFEGLPCRMLVGWFLILWGLTFFFSAIWGFLDVGGGGYSAGYLIVEVLWDLADLLIAGILAVLGLKVLRGECFSTKTQLA
jgi:hypothetical protein